MNLTFGTSEASARRVLDLYRGALNGLGCMCVRTGRSTESCKTLYEGARMDRIAVVPGHPELTAELRAAAECLLAREHAVNLDPLPPPPFAVPSSR